MENHPIPQDVTGFKFRLIGSVTVKQFLYLLGGGVFALIFYLLPIPIFIKIPFMLLSGGIGLCLAFIPIDGRPMDKMIFNFIKAVPAENQYIYKKVGAAMPFFDFNPPVHAQKAQAQQADTRTAQKAKLFNELSKTYFKQDPEDQEKVASLSNLFQEGTAPNQGFTNRVVHADSMSPTSPVSPVKPVSPVGIASVPHAAQESLSQPHAASAPPPIEVHEQKTQDAVSAPVATAPTTPAPQATQQAPAAQTIAPTGGAAASDVANILTGIVKDPRGKPLPHVIVEVIDAHNIPLRTFRTGQNGGFAAATPMPNGTYTIHLEDSLKKQSFSDVHVTLDGNILSPVIISSVDPREELRRELFGGTHA